MSDDDLKATGVNTLDLDYHSEGNIEKAAIEYGDGALDLLINCDGVDAGPRQWTNNDLGDLMEKFRIMAVGPFLATMAFFPQLQKGSAPRVVNVSSAYASISGNDQGENISYRMATAALNQQTVTIAREVKAAGSKVVMLALDPGDIPTPDNQGKGGTDMDESVRGMIDIIDKAKLADSGSFLKWNGEKIPF